MKWQRWPYVRQAKLNLLRFVRLRGTPDEIAKGLALGIFIGMTPTFGIQMVIAIVAAILLRENRLAAVLGVWVTNPFTAPFIYALEYESGRIILGMDRVHLPREFTFAAFGDLGRDLLVPLCLGSLVLGLLSAALAYAITLRVIPLVKIWRIPRWPRRRRSATRDSNK